MVIEFTRSCDGRQRVCVCYVCHRDKACHPLRTSVSFFFFVGLMDFWHAHIFMYVLHVFKQKLALRQPHRVYWPSFRSKYTRTCYGIYICMQELVVRTNCELRWQSHRWWAIAVGAIVMVMDISILMLNASHFLSSKSNCQSSRCCHNIEVNADCRTTNNFPLSYSNPIQRVMSSPRRRFLLIEWTTHMCARICHQSTAFVCMWGTRRASTAECFLACYPFVCVCAGPNSMHSLEFACVCVCQNGLLWVGRKRETEYDICSSVMGTYFNVKKEQTILCPVVYFDNSFDRINAVKIVWPKTCSSSLCVHVCVCVCDVIRCRLDN